MNNIQVSFENLCQEKIQNAINIQQKVMATISADGGNTTYMSSGFAKKGIDFYETFN